MAILWHELWHEGLEEASRLYFGEGNVKGMFAVLEPLHQMMERGPQTLKETSFNQVSSGVGTVSGAHTVSGRGGGGGGREGVCTVGGVDTVSYRGGGEGVYCRWGGYSEW